MMNIKAAGVVASLLVAAFLVLGQPQSCGMGCVSCSDPNGCPDLTVAAPLLRVGMVLDTKEFTSQECSVVERDTTPGTKRVLRMNVGIINQGPGKLELGSPEREPELYDCQACSGSCAVRNMASYRLWRPEDFRQYAQLRESNPNSLTSVLIQGNQRLFANAIPGRLDGFCISDVLSCREDQALLGCEGRSTSNSNSSFPATDPNTCTSNQGISPGHSDFYDNTLEGNWIVLPENLAGQFILEVEVNPTRVFDETDYDNNIAVACVRIPASNEEPSFSEDRSCIVPTITQNASACELCEPVCQDLGMCERDGRAVCDASNCFCGDVCGYSPAGSPVARTEGPPGGIPVSTGFSPQLPRVMAPTASGFGPQVSSGLPSGFAIGAAQGVGFPATTQGAGMVGQAGLASGLGQAGQGFVSGGGGFTGVPGGFAGPGSFGVAGGFGAAGAPPNPADVEAGYPSRTPYPQFTP